MTIVMTNGHVTLVACCLLPVACCLLPVAQERLLRHIKASEFKAKCLKLIDEVAETGEAIVVTKRGKVMARLSREPDPKATMAPLFGCMKGMIEFVDPNDDLLSAWDEEALKRWQSKLDRLAQDFAAPQKTRAKQR